MLEWAVFHFAAPHGSSARRRERASGAAT